MAGIKGKQYYSVVLRGNGKNKSFYVHRLVAKHFIENPLNKKTVNHKDLNKLNNKANNLKWATQKENINHSWNNGACKPRGVKGINHWKSKLTENDVLKIREMLKDNSLTMREIAENFNVTFGCIASIKYKISWKYLK